MDVFLLVLEIVVVVTAIILGVRAGGMGLGVFGAVGVFILVFVFQLPPGAVPGSAMLIILAVITAAATMQAAGGIDYMVMVAARLIRRRPRLVTLVAPLVSYVFVVGAGTSNIFYPLIPVIYEVSYASGIRPERPLSLSTVATAFGITSSPVAAAMAAMLVLVEPKGVTLPQILLVTIPSSVVAIVLSSLLMMRWGKDLAKDPEYQKRLADGKVAPPRALSGDVGGEGEQMAIPASGRRSALIFLLGVVFVMVIALVPALKPSFPVGPQGALEPLGMTEAIQLTMFTVALLIFLLCRVKPAEVIKQPTFSSGVVAIVALFGVAWLANTFIEAHLHSIIGALGGAVESAPFVFAIAVFVVAGLTTSQSATTNTIVPIGLALPGLGVGAIVAMWQALAGVYLLPANGTQLACIETDRTGSTRISKFVIYHSFTIPMLVCTVIAIAVGLVIASVARVGV